MAGSQQLNLWGTSDTRERVRTHIKDILSQRRQPSASELVRELDRAIGVVARWDLEEVLESLLPDKDLTNAEFAFLRSILEGDDLMLALRGDGAPDQDTISTIDGLLQASGLYRSSVEFREMVEFVGRFRDYAPYNNMLVRIQNPSCGFYATAKDWKDRFGRTLKEDARPMLILAPMHPVMLVYDLDQTDGDDLPAELQRFAQFQGQWESKWLQRLVENARRHGIRVDFKKLSSSLAGFATFAHPEGGEKMRVVVHDELSEPSQFGVLCHEMAHILLGHLGSDEDHWWPSRCHLGRSPIEIEAEATAYIVTQHLALEGASISYISRYLTDGAEIPRGVSFDMIAKVSGRIERMAMNLEPAPRTKAERKKRRPQ